LSVTNNRSFVIVDCRGAARRSGRRRRHAQRGTTGRGGLGTRLGAGEREHLVERREVAALHQRELVAVLLAQRAERAVVEPPPLRGREHDRDREQREHPVGHLLRLVAARDRAEHARLVEPRDVAQRGRERGGRVARPPQHEQREAVVVEEVEPARQHARERLALVRKVDVARRDRRDRAAVVADEHVEPRERAEREVARLVVQLGRRRRLSGGLAHGAAAHEALWRGGRASSWGKGNGQETPTTVEGVCSRPVRQQGD
jgi:hypothetical protein